VNIAPLLSLYITGRDAVVGIPPQWSGSLASVNINLDRLANSIVNYPILLPMLVNPLTPSELFTGQIGLVSDPEFTAGWDGEHGETPATGWWPEAIQLAAGPPLAYPADPYPLPELAFFAPIQRPPSADARVVDLARVSFAIAAPAPPQIWPTADGRCGYALSEDEQPARIRCVTVHCPTPCVGSTMTADFGRSAVLCRCSGC
jgi:hypothetical protein